MLPPTPTPQEGVIGSVFSFQSLDVFRSYTPNIRSILGSEGEDLCMFFRATIVVKNRALSSPVQSHNGTRRDLLNR